MRKIAAVTLDLWDTLIQEHPGGSEKVAKARIADIASILGQSGLVHSKEELRDAYDKSAAFLDLTWSKRRDLPLRDQVLFLLNCIDGKLVGRLRGHDLEAIEKAYAESILRNPPVLLPGAKEALRSLKVNEYRIGLISNTGRTPGSVLRIIMHDMGILHYFDVTTFSNELLVRKPAETIFRKTLEGLRVLPKTAVHVGDSAQHDIEGAKRAGMYAIQVVDNGFSRSEAADNHVRSLESVLEHIQRL